MNSLKDYPELVKQVAATLAGRPVEVRFRAPYLVGAAGLALKHNGGAVVDIDPALISREQLSVFLHELAHVKNDWAILPTMGYTLAPGSVDLPEHAMKWLEGQPIEPPADKQAAAWLKYTDQNYLEYPPPDLRARLSCLLAMQIETAVRVAIDNHYRERGHG